MALESPLRTAASSCGSINLQTKKYEKIMKKVITFKNKFSLGLDFHLSYITIIYILNSPPVRVIISSVHTGDFMKKVLLATWVQRDR